MRFLMMALSMMAVSTLDSDDPQTKYTAWILFMVSTLGSTVLFSILTFIISRKADKTMIEAPIDDPSTGMLGKAFGLDEGADKRPKTKPMTVQSYDSQKLREFSFQRTMVPSMIIIFMHYKFGSVVPLVLQSLNSLMGIWNFELVQIHLRGRQAAGKLERPFPAPSMLSMMTGQQEERPTKRQ